MSHRSDMTYLATPTSSSGRGRGEESLCGDKYEAVTPDALLDNVYPEMFRRVPGSSVTQQLALLTWQRHLLAMSRHFLVYQMNVMSLMKKVGESLQSGPVMMPKLVALCVRLREVTRYRTSVQRRIQRDQYLIYFIQDVPRNMTHHLLNMAVTATLLMEQLLLCVLRSIAHTPAKVVTDLGYCLSIYNQVVSDLSRHTSPLVGLQQLCCSRVLGIIAEERGVILARDVSAIFSQSGIVDLLRRETQTMRNPDLSLLSADAGHHASRGPETLIQEDKKTHHTLQSLIQDAKRVTTDLRSSCLLDNGTQENARRITTDQRLRYALENLIQEERKRVTIVLQVLSGLEQSIWNTVPSGSDSALYNQYSILLWPIVCSHVFHTLYPGRRGQGAPPALTPFPEEVSSSVVFFLQDCLTSDRTSTEVFPETCVRNLFRHLLCAQSFLTWDHIMCRTLGSAVTDKCLPSALVSGGKHSRTSGMLVSLCEHLSRLAATLKCLQPSSCQDPCGEEPAVSSAEGILSRCAASLQLCDGWLRRRSLMYVSSGSISQLVLISHGDLPVIKAQCCSLVAAVGNGKWWSVSQRLFEPVQRTTNVLEGLLVSLPRSLGSVCTQRAQELFQRLMPARRYWKRKLLTGSELTASEYAVAAVGAVLQPALEGATSLLPEEQLSALSVVCSVFMEAWMRHILREKLKFSLQGALQLRCDFDTVREVLRCREEEMCPEVMQATLSLPVFGQADNAIMCLLQQPSGKAYLQSGSCFCCPSLCHVAVDSISDSLQSLDSLERRVWNQDTSGRLPRHSRDLYMPQNQRQWLSLRVQKTWNGLSLPWEGRETSEG